MRFVRNVTAALAAALLVAACSTLRFAYNNADTYLRYKAASYVTLDDGARRELNLAIDEFLAWHRANALPEYARIAEEAARRIDDGLSREDVVWGYDSFVANARQTLRVAAERIAPLLDRLSFEQAAQLERGFAEDNRKFAQEYLRGSDADRRSRRAKRVEQRLEDWVGRLSRGQVERVRAFSERAPLYDELRVRERIRLQGELLDMIRRHEARRRLPEVAANWERGRDPAYTAASERTRQEYVALLVDLDRTLSSEQRARAQASFRRYATDFRALAGAAPSR